METIIIIIHLLPLTISPIIFMIQTIIVAITTMLDFSIINNNEMHYNYRGDAKNYYRPYNNISQLGVFREPMDFTYNQNEIIITITANVILILSQKGNMNANIITQSRTNDFSQTQYGNMNSNYNSINGNNNNFQSQKGNKINNGMNHQYNNNNTYFDHNNNNKWYHKNISFQVGIKCRRCGQFRHKVFVCPYSLEEIQKFKGQVNNEPELTKNNDQIPTPTKPLNSN